MVYDVNTATEICPYNRDLYYTSTLPPDDPPQFRNTALSDDQTDFEACKNREFIQRCCKSACNPGLWRYMWLPPGCENGPDGLSQYCKMKWVPWRPSLPGCKGKEGQQGDPEFWQLAHSRTMPRWSAYVDRY